MITQEYKDLTARVNSMLKEGSRRECYFNPTRLQWYMYLHYYDHINSGKGELPELKFEARSIGPIIPEIHNSFLHFRSEYIDKKMMHDGKYWIKEDPSIIRQTVRKYESTNMEGLFGRVFSPYGAWAKAFSRDGDSDIITYDDFKSTAS